MCRAHVADVKAATTTSSIASSAGRCREQFNIGVEVCDRWAERDPRRLAIVAVEADGRADEVTYGWLKRDVEPARQCAARAWHRRGRPRRDSAAAGARGRGDPCRGLQARRRSRCRLPCCSASMRIAYRLQNSGAKALLTNAPGSRQARRVERASPARTRDLSLDGPQPGALGFAETLARASPICYAGRDRGRRAGADGLHLRHHRPAERARCTRHRVLIGHMPGIETAA